MAERIDLLAEIAAVAGDEAAETLARTFGGHRIYIRERITGEDWLSRLVGVTAAAALAQRFTGEYLDIPRRLGARARIRLLRDAGRTVRQIADAVGCTERHVYAVLAEAGADDRQADLFA